MNEGLPRMGLKCRSGELGGARFELGVETFLGVDARDRLVVAPDVKALAKRYALIVAGHGQYTLEKLGNSVAITVNGTPVSGTVELNRFDIIDLGGIAEFVFGHAVTAAMDRVPRPDEVVSKVPPPLVEMPSAPPQRPFGADPLQTQDDSAFRDLPLLTPRARPRVVQGNPPGLPGSGPRANGDESATVVYPTPPFELTISLPKKGLTRYALKFGDNTLGRGDACDISIPDPEKMISRKHAIVRVTGDRVELIDQATANGTFVKGRRIESHVLEAGASFVLGPNLEFKLLRK